MTCPLCVAGHQPTEYITVPIIVDGNVKTLQISREKLEALSRASTYKPSLWERIVHAIQKLFS